MTEPVKGFKDYSGKEAIKREEIRKILVETFERYGFEPVETPIVEQEEFVRGENVSDEAVSDIFKLQDKGKRNLALRYEFTFQLKRLMKNKKLPYKRYQIGEVFRDEPISANRFRQFTQCDVDVVGSGIRNEAEVLALTNEIMITLGIKPLILINNRGLLNEILQDCRVKEKDRLQVLREIDKYGKISANSFVIVHTSWSRYWNNPTQYRNQLQFPSVSVDAAEFLLKRNIAGLGIDTLSPDTEKSGFPVHQLLLSSGKIIIENMNNTDRLKPVGAYLIALPINVSGATESPVRVIALQNT